MNDALTCVAKLMRCCTRGLVAGSTRVTHERRHGREVLSTTSAAIRFVRNHLVAVAIELDHWRAVTEQLLPRLTLHELENLCTSIRLARASGAVA